MSEEVNTIRCVFIDDDKGSLGIISSAVLSVLKSLNYLGKCFAYSDPEAFLRDAPSIRPNLIFCDIEMPAMDGVDVIRKLRAQKSDADVIFVSNREDRVFDSLSVHPFGFVRKKNFIQDINDVIALYLKDRKKVVAKIVVNTREGLVSVKIDDIVYVESQLKYQYFHIVNDRRPIETRMTISEINDELLPKGFISCYKGITVNVAYVKAFVKDVLYLTTGDQVPIAKRKVKEVKERYLALIADADPGLVNR